MAGQVTAHGISVRDRRLLARARTRMIRGVNVWLWTLYNKVFGRSPEERVRGILRHARGILGHVPTVALSDSCPSVSF